MDVRDSVDFAVRRALFRLRSARHGEECGISHRATNKNAIFDKLTCQPFGFCSIFDEIPDPSREMCTLRDLSDYGKLPNHINFLYFLPNLPIPNTRTIVEPEFLIARVRVWLPFVVLKVLSSRC
jgi:hypothetical protein